LSHCGDPTTLSLVPKVIQAIFSNLDFVTALKRRLLIQLQNYPKIELVLA
jgi:hypothetical protein